MIIISKEEETIFSNLKTTIMQNDLRLEKFLYDELKDVYWAEKHLVNTIPKMSEAANSDELRSALNEHLTVTKGHVTRLENVFKLLKQKPETMKCKAMEGITDEGEDIIDDTEDGTATRDAGIILAAQKVEHYEIATYGGLAQLAKTLGHDDVANILEQTLAEEKEADESLSKLAETSINMAAAHEHDN
jgi:ferritin-like metal-binding protein YciE